MKKILRALAVIAGVIGAALVVGTAGESDMEQIGIGQILLQELCGGMLCLSALIIY